MIARRLGGFPVAFIAVLCMLLNVALTAEGTTLTYSIKAGEESCFYVWVEEVGKKVSFYFAVQSGGTFDIDYTVKDPKGTILLEGTKERQGDFVYTVQTIGEHAHCFSNYMSSYSAKLVDFELTAEGDRFRVNAELPDSKKLKDEHLSPLEESLLKISASLSNIARNQKYFRTRENRNLATVESTHSRIFYYSIVESALIMIMSGLQVFVVRTFFKNANRSRL